MVITSYTFPDTQPFKVKIMHNRELEFKIHKLTIWIHPEYSAILRTIGIEWDRQGCLKICMFWYHIQFMYYSYLIPSYDKE